MKSIIVLIALSMGIYAQSYHQILKRAINNSADFKLANSRLKSMELKSNIEQRYKNPSLELSLRDEDNHRYKDISLTQEITFPWVKADKKRLSNTQLDVARVKNSIEKEKFIYNFAFKYLEYREIYKLKNLQKSSISISKKILNITKNRLKEGAITQSDLLQAKLDYTKAVTKLKELDFIKSQKRLEFLLFANLDDSTKIDINHKFYIHKAKDINSIKKLTNAQKRVAQKKLSLASHNIESIEIFGEVEEDINQDIIRVGISMPIPIFNSKSQEKQLAKIELANSDIIDKAQDRRFRLEIVNLKKEIKTLKSLKQSYQSEIKKAQKLLKLYQNGYRLAQINLLKLNILKQKLLESKSNILKVDTLIQKSIIKINYLQGSQNG